MEENKYKPVIVIDASVILKWILTDESHRDIAIAIRNERGDDKTMLFVPEHTYTEVANVLAFKGSGNVAEIMHRIFDTGLLVLVFHRADVTNKAFEIMKQYKGVSFYDAVYHALAIVHDGTFVTADEKYYQLTKKIGHSQLLKDY